MKTKYYNLLVRFAANKTFRENLRKNAKIFVRISRNFRENKWSDKCQNEAKFREHFFQENLREKLYFVKRLCIFFLFRESFEFFREIDCSEVSSKKRKFSHFFERTKCEKMRNDFSFSLQTIVNAFLATNIH